MSESLFLVFSEIKRILNSRSKESELEICILRLRYREVVELQR